MLKAVFFDLDYTLYDQTQYLLGALRDVGARIASECGRDPAALSESLRATWEREGTDCKNLFDRWLTVEGLLEDRHVRTCVEAFHDHLPPRLEPYGNALRVLDALRGEYRVGIVTDGHAGMQRSKIGALGLEPRVDRIVLPYELGLKKPDPRIFEYVLREEGLAAEELLYVGDHPIKDVVCASRAGVPTVRVLSGEFRALPDAPEHPPTYRVRDLSEVPRLVGLTPEPALLA